MTLYQIAKEIKSTIREGTAWVAIYVNKRKWEYKTFWLDDTEAGLMVRSPADALNLLHILLLDSEAILVNGYSIKVDRMEGFVTIKGLESTLQWLYHTGINQLPTMQLIYNGEPLFKGVDNLMEGLTNE